MWFSKIEHFTTSEGTVVERLEFRIEGFVFLEEYAWILGIEGAEEYILRFFGKGF